MKKVVPPNAILIPDNATKVFDGQIFTIYQWPQEMFDGTTKTFELLKRPDTVQVIAVRGDKLVLVNDEQPGRAARVHFPGGRVDPEDKSWLYAAQRELKEETGLTFENWRLVNVVQPLPKIEWFVPFYLATELKSEAPQAVDLSGERITVELCPFDVIRDEVLSGNDSTLHYAMSLFARFKTLEELLALPEFEGSEVDR